MHFEGQLPIPEAETQATWYLQEHMVTHQPLDYSREGHIYILQSGDTGIYKIGRSFSPKNRQKELQAGSAQPLQLLREVYARDCVALERLLHKRYGMYRQKGEWFSLPPDLLRQLLQEDFSL